MNTKQQKDETKISVFRDGRFTQQMIIAGVNAAHKAIEANGITTEQRLILIVASSFAAMIKAYDAQQECGK